MKTNATTSCFHDHNWYTISNFERKKVAKIERKRLNMILPISIHNQLAKMATKYNITITRYILRLIIEQFNKEKVWDNE
jgi:hypothetical protein